MADNSFNNTLDERDAAITFLRSELTKHKEMLSEVLVMKARWQKNRDAYGKRYTALHNDYVILIDLLQKHGIPLPDLVTPAMLKEQFPVVKANKGRKRWKGIAA